jgi:alkaline phosphatase D
VRRVVVSAVAVSAALVCVAPAGAEVKDFNHGVTAGEVTHNSARIWTLGEGSGKVRAQVATDRRFRHVVARRRAKVKASNDGTVQTNVKGLEAEQLHYYRFCGSDACSPKGKFKTAPKPKANETIRFAYTGDTDATRAPGQAEPFFGPFEVFKAMRDEKNDFNIHFGDTIYSDSEVGGVPPALTVEEKWEKYRLNIEELNLYRLRKSAGFYSHWDDHEFINDFSIPEDGRQIYDAGVKAFRDYAPVTYSERDGLYRSFRWGKNAELFFLDQLSFRSGKASAGGTCDNPETGEPDLAPTLPQSTRTVFSNLIPSLDRRVTQQCTDAINDPNRTVLGTRQFNRFIDAVDESTARWKIVLNEKPIMQIYGLPYDRWEGYAFERIQLLNQLEQRGVGNVLFLTTDTHAAFQNVIGKRTLAGDVAPSNAPAGPTDTSYQDFIIGPVATNPFWPEIDDVTGGSGNGRLLSQVFFRPDPPNGLGMRCTQGDVFSYAEVTVSNQQVLIEYKTETGEPVLDVNGDPCGPYTITPFGP